MPYNRNRVPDAPMTPGMLPRAVTLHDSDFVIVIQPVNDTGQKTRTCTLSQLAGYIAGGGVSSITFTGENGYTATASGEGFNYHKDATVEDQAARDFGIDDDGIHATVTTSNYTKKFEVLPDGVKYSKTAGGLTNKVEIFEDYVLITHQVQNGATVETHTSRIGWDSMRAPVLNVMQDENNLIPISWDVTNGELVIWRRANNGKVAVPKLHVYGTLNVEKDTTIAADVVITKSVTVGGRADFNGNFTVIKNLYSTDYAELGNRTKVERLNIVKDKSHFEVSENSDVSTLVGASDIASTAGDIVTVRNTSGGDLALTIGNYESNQHYTIQLNAYCSMAFIRTGVTTGTGVQWSPLGNCEVTIE